MRVKLYDEFGASNSKPVFDALSMGITNNGDHCVDSFSSADAIVIWSVLFTGRMAENKSIFERAQRENIPVIILEVGALNRGQSWKLGIGGINNTATWCTPYEENRWSKFNIECKDWKTDGEFITIFTQRPDSQQWLGMPSIQEWVTNHIEDVKQYTDKPIVIRPHPRDRLTKWGFLTKFKDVYFDTPQMLMNTYDGYNHEEIMNRTYCAINHSSGPSIQAVLDGVKVLCSQDSLAWDVSIQDVSNINQDCNINRQEWLDKIAHTEFFIDELAEGVCWANLCKHL